MTHTLPAGFRHDMFAQAWAALFVTHTCSSCERGVSGPHPRRCMEEDRFWRRVKFGPGCWEWTGFIKNSGYGSFSPRRGKTFTAHRASWLLVNGEIPEGLVICHRCDNKKCVRPDHLFLGTHSDNIQDMIAKGRGAWQRKP